MKQVQVCQIRILGPNYDNCSFSGALGNYGFSGVSKRTIMGIAGEDDRYRVLSYADLGNDTEKCFEIESDVGKVVILSHVITGTCS